MNELEQLFLGLIDKTKRLIDTERKRSNIFLVLGLLVAGTGIYYFIWVTDPDDFIYDFIKSDSGAPENLTELTKKDGFFSLWIFSVLPKTIAFIFIEYFAFFFFRLYRSSQNTINKLIDSLKIREENYVVFSVYQNQKKDLDPNELFNRLCFFENTDIMKSNELSKSLELEKLSSNETNILNEIIGLLKNK